MRTKIVLDPEHIQDNVATFNFRGFKGTYELALIDQSGKDVRIINGNTDISANVELKF